MKGLKYILGTLLFTSVSIAQTNSPCTGMTSIATALPLSTTCSFTTVNNIGSTEQSNPPNGGTPGCSLLGEDSWYSFTAPASGLVSFESQAGTITDGAIAIYSGPCGSLVEIACDDDSGPGFMPELNDITVIPGNEYFIRIWDYNGGTGNFDLCIIEEPTPPPPPTNLSCATMDPICSGTPINFTAQSTGTSAFVTDPGNDYDCLFSAPNPTWFYLEIDTPGDLAIDVTAGSDIDFAIWGPYTDLATAQADCGTYPAPQDCSYSASAIEQANVNGVLAGEVYVLLVTNFAATIQNITINEAGTNTATTDCSIVTLPIELTSFIGVVDGRNVDLNWTTATEKNNSHFALEHSTDGISWETITIIEGSGNTSTESNYSFKHQNANSDLNYYRLKQFDFDGTVFVADVISVSKDAMADLTVYPNPSKEFITIKSNKAMSEIVLMDLTGNIIKRIIPGNTFSETINLMDVENGIYIVNSTVQGRKISKKIIVAK